MPVQDQLAGLAGAALGYIHRNTRGAIKGYYAGTKLSQYSRTGMSPLTPRSTPKKRKLSVSAGTARRWIAGEFGKAKPKNGTGSGKSNYNRNYRSLGSNAAAVRVRRKKGVSFKKKKAVVVTSKFKQKVHKALDEEIKGRYLKITYFRIAPPTLLNTQTYLDDGLIYQPLHFADAADILFNRAAAVESPTTALLDWQNVAIRKDRIIDSWVTYELKNMSQRTYTVKFYQCKPKSTGPTNAAPNDAFADWTVGLQTAVGAGTNPLSNTPSTLYSTPYDSPQFNQLWSAQCTTVLLSPGESHTFRVQGPNQYVLDYMKFWNKSIVSGGDYLAPWGNFTRSCFFVAYPDLVTSSVASVGRYPSGTTGGGGLIGEKKQYFKLACPASAGFQYPGTFAGSTNQQLNNKLPCKVIATFSQALSGTTEDVLEDQPAVIINPLD